MSPATANTLAFGVHLLTRFQCDPPTEGQTLEEYTVETLAFTLELHKEFKGKGTVVVCKGTTKKGSPCKRAGTNDGYCKTHLPTPVVDFAPLVVPEPEPEPESQTLTPDDSESEPEPEPAQVPVEDEIRSKKTKCAGQGKKGPCKSKPMKGSEFCRRHQGSAPKESPVWTQCEADGCTDTAEDDSEFCETHGSEITEPVVAPIVPKPKSKTIMPESVPEESEEDIFDSILNEF